MPISNPLGTANRLTKTQLESFMKDLKNEPASTQEAELNKLLQAGAARLPDGAGSEIRDAIFSLRADAFDPAQGAQKRPQTPSLKEAKIEQERAMDPGVSVSNNVTLLLDGAAQKGASFEVVNLSRSGSPVIGNGTVDDSGKLELNNSTNRPNFAFGDKIGVRIKGPNGGVSEMAVLTPESVEVRKWKSGTTRRYTVEDKDVSKPMLNHGAVKQETTLPTPKDKSHHMLLVGGAGATEPFATVQVQVGDELQKTKALEDGSFFLDVKGVVPGQAYQLQTVDEAGHVGARNYNAPALKFDSQALANSTQGVPYDRIGDDGKAHEDGPFLRFAAEGVTDPHNEVEITNLSTGDVFTGKADENGNVNLEIDGVHAGDQLSIKARSLAGHYAQQTVNNWVVPGEGAPNPRLAALECANNLLGAQVQEMVDLIKQNPTSANRDLIQGWLDAGAANLKNPRDKALVEKAMTQTFCGANDIITNAKNPAPKEPIVIDAHVIKPRVMDRGNAAGRDPLEVRGKAEPFAEVEIRNASQPNAPVIGTVTADKDGNFDFLSTNERLFLHGDQLLVKARDAGGAESTNALAHTCAYELQVWNATNRTELVELPMETDTRNPFLDVGKLANQAMVPITKNAKEQVYNLKGGPLSAEPNSIMRVTTQQGETYETKVKKDGSFDLNVGKVTPGETLNVQAFDVSGRTVNRNFNTPALRFDSQTLLASTQGVPFNKLDADGKPDAAGPFLKFDATDVVDPFSKVSVTNNTTGKSMEVQADENGRVAFTLAGVHTGDSVSIHVTDPAGNEAPNQLTNFVVPGEPSIHADLVDIECQRTFLPEHIDQMIEIITADPTAAHREVLDGVLEKKADFANVKDFDRLQKFAGEVYGKNNDVRSYAVNPAPKEPIVIDAEIIKPREMEPRPAPPRRPGRTTRPRRNWAPLDPLFVRGRAEPFSTVEIRNASQPNAPVIGTVQTDENGVFDFESRDERLFLHGDQVLVRARDQAGVESKDELVTTCQYEMQVWFSPPRTETIKLSHDHDTRNPFLDNGKVEHGQVPAKKTMDTQVYRFTGNELASEPNAVVRVTNKAGEHFEAQVKPDGTFKLDVAYEPGESLSVQVFDINGRTVNRNYNTPALKFDPAAFVETSEGAPYTKPNPGAQQDQDAPARLGPFLRFAQEAAVDPFSTVTIKNNSTGAELEAQADANGNLDVEIDGVHSGDSLAFTVKDPAGNTAPNALANYVVPGEPRPTSRVSDIICLQQLKTEDATELIGLLKDNRTAANRGAVEHWLEDDHSTFMNAGDKKRVADAVKELFSGANDVRTESTNPAPKDPIVLDAQVIKPRVMDQGNARGRDPLEVRGEAEPFTTIEIVNASRQGSPVIGTVQTDKNGEFDFLSTDERLFLHGDQLLVRATDQGGAASGQSLTETCAYELRVWNQQNRTEKVRLPQETDTRNPFLDQSKVQNVQAFGVKGSPDTKTTLTGAPGSAEPNSIVRVETSKGQLHETKVAKDGSFELEVGSYVPGETLTANVFDVSGRTYARNFKTDALPFDPAKLTASVDGPPYQRVKADGKEMRGGPFLDLNAPEGTTFPGATLEVTNHATGKVQTFEADDKGAFDMMLRGVHAHDLLSFKVKDAEGNEAPTNLRAWQVPAESQSGVDPTIQGLTSNRPISEAAVEQLVQALTASPTLAHRGLCEQVLANHPDWFLGDAAKDLEKAIGEIFQGEPQKVPDASNPRPRMPIVLGAEIYQSRVMDSGNAPTESPRVTGLAEPMSTVEVYNGSVSGRPLLGSVQVGADGKFNVALAANNNFQHGDQVVVMAKDAGGAQSDAVSSRGTAFEVRVWNATGRKEKVALGADKDGRNPFLDAGKLSTQAADGTQQSGGSLVIAGGEGAAEVFSKISVTVGDDTYETEADINGSFQLPVPGAKVGEQLTLNVTDPNGREYARNYKPVVQ